MLLLIFHVLNFYGFCVCFSEELFFTFKEEAMQSFVSPETLDGGNQYFCEKCNKKCDAHKVL